MKHRALLLLALLTSAFTIAYADCRLCVTNSYGEESNLVLTKTSPGNFCVTGTHDYTSFGGTIWPVRGTYNSVTGKLHYRAINPNPDHCKYWADKVTFDYTIIGTSAKGDFYNDCGLSGEIKACAVRGGCHSDKTQLKVGEFGTTGSPKMKRSEIPLRDGDDINRLLKGIEISVSPNPTMSSVQVAFALQNSSKLQVGIYDNQGNLIRTLSQGTANAGNHSYTWNLRSQKGINVPRGTYWVRVTTEEGVLSKQIVVER